MHEALSQGHTFQSQEQGEGAAFSTHTFLARGLASGLSPRLGARRGTLHALACRQLNTVAAVGIGVTLAIGLGPGPPLPDAPYRGL